MSLKVLFPTGKKYFSYGFPNHPLSSQRHFLALKEIKRRGLLNNPNLVKLKTKMVDEKILTLFHSKEYVEKVKRLSKLGFGFLDTSDNPVFQGMYEIASHVVYAAIKAVELVVNGNVNSSFNMVGGLHHAFRDKGEGFCVFNDVGVAVAFTKRVKVKLTVQS